MIDQIVEGVKFDVVDVILQGIASSKNDRVKRIYYAPYIMALIIRKIEFRGGLGSVHKPYKPRDAIAPRQVTEDDPMEADAPAAPPVVEEEEHLVAYNAYELTPNHHETLSF